MADVTATAFTVIFIGILLLIGAVVFGSMAQPMGDQRYVNETVIDSGAAGLSGCSDDNASTESTLCSGTVAHPPIENVTRAVPVLVNCSNTTAPIVCTAMTIGTDWNYTKATGLIHIMTGVSGDINNGTIKATYWFDRELGNAADRAQQSITSTVYGGFDLATVMVIVMAAVAIVGTIFLIGRPGG